MRRAPVGVWLDCKLSPPRRTRTPALQRPEGKARPAGRAYPPPGAGNRSEGISRWLSGLLLGAPPARARPACTPGRCGTVNAACPAAAAVPSRNYNIAKAAWGGYGGGSVRLARVRGVPPRARVPPGCLRCSSGPCCCAAPRGHHSRPRGCLAIGRWPRPGERRLCRGQARDGHAEGRAAHVVQAEFVAERDGGRIAPVLAADADLEVGPGAPPALDAEPHELAHPRAVERLERVARQDLLLDVRTQELGLGIVAREAEDGLREVVGPEAEELRQSSDLVSHERGPRDLDHRAELVVDLRPRARLYLLGGSLQHGVHAAQLLEITDERDHDLGVRLHALALQLDSCLEDSADLHLVDRRVEQAQAAAAQPEHRVRLAQGAYCRQQALALSQPLGVRAPQP